MREFAQEIVDKVIDFAAPSEIEACGLVCRRWLPRNRYHLFSKVILTRNNLSAFVDIVDISPLPILSYIQHIHFDFDRSPLDESFLERIHPCPNLICIRIEDDIFADYSQFQEFNLELLRPNIQSWAAESGSISRLELALKLVDLPVESLRSILSCVPAIETLHIDGYDLGWLPRSFHGAPVPPFTLDHLRHLTVRIDRSGCDDFFTWLIAQPPMPLLRSLKVYVRMRWHSCEQMKEYFRLQGGNLEALQLYVEPGDQWEESLVLYRDIFQCTTTTLKQVSFTCGHPSHILDILPLLPSSDWQSITVSIISEEEKGTEMDLSTIHAALAEPRFRTLKHFSVRGAEEFDDRGLLILD
ncbi:hypothetical protein B0H11DRAFT_2187741 [Mycena galericulata]|nr:hypothetical protein B0H11DRAFT_2187741 [Mycena galericulata]